MPRVFNQKIKILYLMRIFLEQTDEEHPMSVKELIAYLNSLGISTRPVFILPVGNLSFRS